MAERVAHALDGGRVVCAWGVHGAHMDQDETVMGWLDDLLIKPVCLGLTAAGAPLHPLYVAYDAKPARYLGRNRAAA